MTDLRHLSREEQKLLADVALLVQNDDQEFNYEMLKAAAPDEASGEFWFRMAETLSTLPPNRSLDLRLNGGSWIGRSGIVEGIPSFWTFKENLAPQQSLSKFLVNPPRYRLLGQLSRDHIHKKAVPR